MPPVLTSRIEEYMLSIVAWGEAHYQVVMSKHPRGIYSVWVTSNKHINHAPSSFLVKKHRRLHTALQ